MTTKNSNPKSHRQPPVRLLGSLRFLGPGLILSASIVGSGELIATTVLGAKAGFVVLWVLILGCLIKVAVQLEYGKHCICYGNSAFQAWNGLSGPRLGRLHWTVHAGLLSFSAMMIGMGAVMGSAAEAAGYAFGGVRMEVWLGILWLIIAVLVSLGWYRLIEIAAVLMNTLFVGMILYCVFAVQSTKYAFSWQDVAGGFGVRIPGEALILAFTAFGITGIGSGEIIMYPYWCLEKGYAAWTGPRDDSEAWAARARGWIRVMTLDAVVSMIVYTIVTVAFYILGASVLHSQPEIKDGHEMIMQLSLIFSEVLGSNTTTIFMIGAFVVLFSTAFANTAGYQHVWSDLLGLYRIYDPDSPVSRKRVKVILAIVFPAIWGLFYLWLPQPVLLVTILGIANSVFLLVVAYQAIIFRFYHTDKRLMPSRIYDVFLVISVLAIGFIATRSLAGVANNFLTKAG